MPKSRSSPKPGGTFAHHGKKEANSPEKEMAESQLRELYEGHSQDYAIFSLDPNGYIMTWNDGAARMKQYSREEAIGKHYSMLYPEDARQEDMPMEHLRVAAREGRYRGEGVRVKKSGQLFLADVQITPIYKNGTLIGFSKVVADITEQGKLRHVRDEKIQELQSERALREKFVSALSHDLKNPLGAVQSALELIGKDTGLSKSSSKLVELALRTLGRIDQMISDLLDANRIKAGSKISAKLAPCDLRQIVTDVKTEFEMSYGARFEIQAQEPVQGYWDAGLLRRVVENLLSNAIKYGDPSMPIGVQLKAANGRVALEVHNGGPPIPKEDQKQLFEQFHRSGSANRSGKRGWGIGLTLVRGFVEAHGGQVQVRSSDQEGTTFIVSLPSDAWPAVEQQKTG